MVLVFQVGKCLSVLNTVSTLGGKVRSVVVQNTLTARKLLDVLVPLNLVLYYRFDDLTGGIRVFLNATFRFKLITYSSTSRRAFLKARELRRIYYAKPTSVFFVLTDIGLISLHKAVFLDKGGELLFEVLYNV